MGTKEKFWYQDDDGEKWLFKFARSGTGEHWSEKVAAEIGNALGIPCARVELGICGGRPGIVSRTFIEEGRENLVHGNELLQQVDESYPKMQLRGVSKHTIEAVLGRLEHVQAPRGCGPDLVCAADCFVGYLLLDAVIVNCDRHHENWGLLQRAGDVEQLTPSYDHASSLGRELSDKRRCERLQTKDSGFTVAAYIRRARSCLYASEGDSKALHPAEAYRMAGDQRPEAMAIWIERLREVSEDYLERIVARVPDVAISAPAREFALAVLRGTRQDLVASANPSEGPSP